VNSSLDEVGKRNSQRRRWRNPNNQSRGSELFPRKEAKTLRRRIYRTRRAGGEKITQRLNQHESTGLVVHIEHVLLSVKASLYGEIAQRARRVALNGEVSRFLSRDGDAHVKNTEIRGGLFVTSNGKLTNRFN